MWYKAIVYEEKDEVTPTTSLSATLKQCDSTFFPNVHKLLLLLATTPVTSCEAERVFSQMKLVKSSLRSTMTTDRLESLVRLRVHDDFPINCTDIVRKVME